MAQQIIKEVDGSFKSFFGSLKLAKEGKYNIKDCRLPHYLSKAGYTSLIIVFVRIKRNKLIIPFSNSYKKTHKQIEIKIPPIFLLEPHLFVSVHFELVLNPYFSC